MDIEESIESWIPTHIDSYTGNPVSLTGNRLPMKHLYSEGEEPGWQLEVIDKEGRVFFLNENYLEPIPSTVTNILQVLKDLKF
jgi:hypothetical protein